MAQNRLIHDVAYAGATVLADKMEEKLGPEERAEFHRLAYQVIKGSIEGYNRHKAHETTKIRPSRN